MSEPARSTHLLRSLNSNGIMRFALSAGRFTTTDAVTATSLTRATVLSVCDDLVQAGWLVADDEPPLTDPPGRGRPARRYRIRGQACVVGIDAGDLHFTALVADASGAILAKRSSRIDSRAAGRAGRRRVARDLTEAALADAGRALDDVLVTAVGFPAPVDASGASPEGVMGFWPLMNAGFNEVFDGLVLVENDANLAALAEHARDETSTRNSATLLSGERFGAGLIVDGRLLRGTRGGAGELRFIRDDFGESYGASGIAALTRTWADDAVRAQAPSSGPLAEIPQGAIEPTDVLKAAAAGDTVAQKVAEDIARRIAEIALLFSSVLDIDRLIVAGGLTPAIGPLLERAQTLVSEDAYAPQPAIVASALGSDVVALGAIQLAVSRLREDPLAITPPWTRAPRARAGT